MGYYDEHYTERDTRQKRSRRGGALSAFIGAVVGGLVVLLSVPLLSNLGILPYNAGDSQGEDTSLVASEQPEDVQTVSYSVNTDVTQAVDQVSDAVVGVINIQQSNPFQEQGGEGTGSGVIYKAAGDKAFVVTNHHVIDRANGIEVSLADGTRVPAELLGSDVITDLAVLEIDSENIDTVAEFGNSDSLRVGEPAIAIGNPLGLRFSSSVTQGIISATERSIPVDLTGNGQVDWHAEVLQTDAAINPGNSGGALLNIEGQVIGINSMKIAQSSVEGIGFAIPTSVALPIIEDLERYGEVKRPQLGVGIQSLNEIPSYHWQETLNLPSDVRAGVMVSSVSPMSAAERAGLEQYDVIVEIDGEEITDGHDLRRFLYTEKQVGDEVEVTYYRNGSRETVTVQLAEQQSF
ncbi:serine protease Do HtrC [Alkalihalophilus pseudofirmus OF4]|uniref:Serine protease Do HtrC n=2 Tax=Alkalihalophilus TaxID=2893060 RepID=D3FQE7_ALKPO|nr:MULTISPECIES: trypsin-like peptidase domain-containing protein [Alkalihalophilus]ADC49619.1 serine protease Do HtrC [Alkalihalophilus pseudofirmus OF4]ERN51640.1 serine protease [Alkalihalophilus marmarensis DSM 21297]MCM3490790.1 trypsin-like peptidase domain-containing protein [Alkalihalophilus marmarensis]